MGPYALYGSELVAACAAAGTDYCDLTGELPWLRSMIDAHDEGARQSGARIVHSCGFDSIPSDLGVFFLQDEMMREYGLRASRIKYRVRDFRGGISGGTAASAEGTTPSTIRPSGEPDRAEAAPRGISRWGGAWPCGMDA